ncbi:hypothetical protein, partial [Henriciella mobilis]|uniref:hypothetical protein n=1 Tax=Henriciella mobilis TaxID=2305467 RepID=UPI001F1C132C
GGFGRQTGIIPELDCSRTGIGRELYRRWTGLSGFELTFRPRGSTSLTMRTDVSNSPERDPSRSGDQNQRQP